MRVADRYGDNGLVAVALALPDGAHAYRLDSFLMSCRVLGRKVEHALVWSIARRARARAKLLLGEFIPTKKNAPAANFFADVGFAPDDREHRWRLDLDAHPAPAIGFEIIEESMDGSSRTHPARRRRHVRGRRILAR